MQTIKMLGKKFDGTGSYEFENYDFNNLDHYFSDISHVKNLVYNAIINSSDSHSYEKDKLISFLLMLQKEGAPKNDHIKHTEYFSCLYSDFIDSLIDEIFFDELGGRSYDFNDPVKFDN